MVRHARAMVRDGALGAIRQIQVEYIQGHLAAPTEADRDPAANWRFSAAGRTVAGAGRHRDPCPASRRLRHRSRARAARRGDRQRGARAPGGRLRPSAAALRQGGARGSMWVTNSAAGAEHGLRIRVFGEQGGLEWQQEDPNHLLHRPLDGFAAVLTRGRPGLEPAAARATRVALGHPEGYFEAFANLYADAAEAIVARRTGRAADPLALDYPTVRGRRARRPLRRGGDRVEPRRRPLDRLPARALRERRPIPKRSRRSLRRRPRVAERPAEGTGKLWVDPEPWPPTIDLA